MELLQGPQRPGMWATWTALLRDDLHAVRAGGSRLIGVLLAFHLATLLLAFPLINWLFREALRATGMHALDLGTLSIGGGTVLTIGLILIICALALWLVSLQFAVLVVLLRRSSLGLPLTAKDVLTDLLRFGRKLVRPSSFPLIIYLFVVLPLTGFGFTTAFAQGIAIPSFITGELMKSQASAAALTVFLLVLAVLNVRLALTLPVFALTDATGGKALVASWRLTRGWAVLPLIGSVFTVMAAAGFASLALAVGAIVPTAITDEATPGASPLVAALSLGTAQVLGMLLVSVTTALIGAVLIAYLQMYVDRLPARLPLHVLSAAHTPRITPRVARLALTAFSVVLAIVFSALAIDTMQRLASQPSTLVLGHRGFSDGGVENTIGGLEAASAAGADLVEMDVMQSKDGQFIAMHDAGLSRLADIDMAVKDLTFDELTAITVRDLAGNADLIPSFRDYVTRADELDMPLLVEIKLGGGDTEDHVERLIAELEEIGSLENHIYHSLDAQSVAKLKQLRPDLTVGYTMAFAGLGVPDTSADFVVIEEWSATQEMQDAAEKAGLGFMAWTVNDEKGIRELLRRDVDGIITDHPDRVLQARTEIREEQGLADTLLDALTRFVVVF
ncbi:glycerophosphoryl diester phosphodiesterase membrane domain-containing protein [Leucobacter sp. W1153]|uniref:glycerophosphoryl diester phosphodiesterase membrane domain-containing protein n=1 Tax=Leucobacter sp. W1153 TaxID=3439064 RepID=UPI003F3813BE